MKKKLLLIFFNLFVFSAYSKVIIIKNSGAKFSPEKVEIGLGDTIKFELEKNHNALEVEQTTWDKNEATAKKDGFKTDFGGGYVLPMQLQPGNHFFVCAPHASMQMKGVISVRPAPCDDFKVFIEKFQNDKMGDSICSGSIIAQVKGGVQPFNFLWNNGMKEKDLFKLCEGVYSLSVTDSRKCSTTVDQKIIADTIIKLFPCENFNVEVDIINDLMGDSVCTGALISKIEGGTSPFKFKWSNGSELPAIKGLCKGEYKVLVTDAENCSRIIIKQVGVDDLKNPCNGFYAKIYSIENSSKDSLNCNGALKTMIMGGKAPFDFTWSNGAKSSFITNLCPGDYTVEIKDSNNCSIKLSGNIQKDFIKNNCEGFYAKISKFENDKSGDGICSGLIATETFGGTKPYIYDWNNGKTSSYINQLCVGKYQVVIKDANDCEFKIERFIGSDSIINPCKNMFAFISESIDITEKEAVCDGKLTAKVQGGTMPYSYNWSNGDSTATASNLCDESYKVMIKDAKGCLVTLCASVTKKAAKPIKLIAKIYTYDISSADSCNGIAKIAVTGGIAPYTYAHSNGNNTYAATQLCAGLYSVVVKDANNESIELKYLISAPANKHENENLKDSTLIDTVKNSPKNECNLNYNAIDSVRIKDVKVNKKDTLGVTWVVYSGSDIFFISQVYCLGKGKGVYKLKLELYCDQGRSIGNYLSASENFYYSNEGNANSIPKINQANFVIYPNPFETNCNIKMEKADDYQVTIFDLSGKEVYFNNFKNSNFIQMDLSNLNKGVYIVKLNGNSNNTSFKISK